MWHKEDYVKSIGNIIATEISFLTSFYIWFLHEFRDLRIYTKHEHLKYRCGSRSLCAIVEYPDVKSSKFCHRRLTSEFTLLHQAQSGVCLQVDGHCVLDPSYRRLWASRSFANKHSVTSFFHHLSGRIRLCMIDVCLESFRS